MHLGQAITAGFSNYANFHDRASRSAFWYWVLFVILGTIATLAIDAVTITIVTGPKGVVAYQWGTHVLSFAVVVFLPYISVAVRRLHDLDRSGWWLLLKFVPLIGGIILLIWFCTGGTGGPNRFGPDPLRADRMAAAPRAA